MTVCDLCKGTGKLLKPWYSATGAMTCMTGDICFMCDGKGTVGEPMTNEDWLKSLDTEQLAEFVIKAMLFYDNAGITMLEAIKNAVEDNENLSKYFIENVVGWLKQQHIKE